MQIASLAVSEHAVDAIRGRVAVIRRWVGQGREMERIVIQHAWGKSNVMQAPWGGITQPQLIIGLRIRAARFTLISLSHTGNGGKKRTQYPWPG